MKASGITIFLLIVLVGCDIDMRKISRAYTDFVTRDGGAWVEDTSGGTETPVLRLTFHKDPDPDFWASEGKDTVDYEGLWAWGRNAYLNGRGHVEISGGKEHPVTIAVSLVARPYGPEDKAFIFVADTAGETMKLKDRKGIEHIMHRVH